MCPGLESRNPLYRLERRNSLDVGGAPENRQGAGSSGVINTVIIGGSGEELGLSTPSHMGKGERKDGRFSCH